MQRRLIITLFLLLGLAITSYAQPAPPQNLTAAVDTTGRFLSVRLSWDSVAAGGEAAAVRYIVYKKSGGAEDTGRFSRQPFRLENNSYVDRFVRLGNTYSYYVTAVDSARRQSAPSDTVTIALPAAPNPGSIGGLVTDSLTGSPLVNARVALIPVEGFHFTHTRTDSSGRYSASVLPGSYIVAFDAPGYRREFYNNARRLSEAARVTLNSGDSLTDINAALFSRGPENTVTLSGTVSDSAGNPLQARVRALVLHQGSFQHRFRNAQTDSSGNYSIRLRQGDSVIIHAQPLDNQYQPQFYNNKNEISEADKILVNGDTSGINFTLNMRPVYQNSISGQVLGIDSTGASVGVAASITAYRLRENSPQRFSTSVMTDSLGSYTLNNLVPGSYILLAIPVTGYLPTFYKADTSQSLSWRDADSLTVTESSSDSNINFVVQPVPDSGFVTITGTVKSNTGAAVGGAIIYFTDENGNVVGYTFSDAEGNYSMPFLSPGTYTVWVDKVNFTGSNIGNIVLDYSAGASQTVDLIVTPVTVTAIEYTNTVVKDYELSQNYPNPFNPSTQINFQLPSAGLVTLKIYNSIGQEVMTLVNEFKPAGKYTVTFNAGNLSSGVYLYKITSGSFEKSHKMVLLK